MDNIIKAEKRRFKFRRIKKYVGKKKSALNRLIVPPHTHPTVDNEEEEFILRRKEMERIIIDRNSKHLNQAHQSAVVQSGIVSEIAEEMIQIKILDGEYSTQKDEGFHELAQGMKRKKASARNVIEPEVLKTVYKKCKGGKTSAHKVMSYGVLKCLTSSEVVMKLLANFYTKLIQNKVTLTR